MQFAFVEFLIPSRERGGRGGGSRSAASQTNPQYRIRFVLLLDTVHGSCQLKPCRMIHMYMSHVLLVLADNGTRLSASTHTTLRVDPLELYATSWKRAVHTKSSQVKLASPGKGGPLRARAVTNKEVVATWKNSHQTSSLQLTTQPCNTEGNGTN